MFKVYIVFDNAQTAVIHSRSLTA